MPFEVVIEVWVDSLLFGEAECVHVIHPEHRRLQRKTIGETSRHVGGGECGATDG